MDSTTKVCKDCGLEKPLEGFYKDAAAKDGHQHYCKLCLTARNRQAANKRVQTGRERREREIAAFVTAGVKECRRCGKAKPFEDFYTSKDTIDGYRGVCKPCLHETAHQRRGPIAVPKSVEERLQERIGQRGPDECWPWTGNASMGFWIDGDTINARRALLRLRGVDIPDDMKVTDSCGNHRCMNDAHFVLRPKGNGLRYGKKICSACRLEKPLAEFGRCASGSGGRYNYCKPCAREDRRKVRRENPRAIRRANLAKYGLTIESHAAMVEEQGGVCAICGGPGGIHGLVIDHDHVSGLVRQLCCSSCNAGIAMFQDDPERIRKAAAYVERWAGVIASRVSQVG